MLGGIQSMSRNDAHWLGFVKCCCYWLSINCVSINCLCFTALSSFDNDWLKKVSWTWILRSHSLSNQSNTSLNITRGLTHWGRVTHICVGNLTIIRSDHGLSPGRRQAIIWTNTEISLIGLLGTNFSDILIKINIYLIDENAIETVVCKMVAILSRSHCVNSSHPGQNDRYFADDIFKGIFMDNKFCISIQISLKFVLKGRIDNKSALVQVMVWRQTMVTTATSHYPNSLTLICGTRGRWVKGLPRTFPRIQPPNAETLYKITSHVVSACHWGRGWGKWHRCNFRVTILRLNIRELFRNEARGGRVVAHSGYQRTAESGLRWVMFNTLRTKQNIRLLADELFKCISPKNN